MLPGGHTVLQLSPVPSLGWHLPFTSQSNPSLTRPRAGSCSQWGKSTVSVATLQSVNGMKEGKELSGAHRSSCAGWSRAGDRQAGGMLLHAAFQHELHQHLLCLVSPWEFKLRREKLKQKTPSKQAELSVGFAAAAQALPNQHILHLSLVGSSAASSPGLSQPASPKPAWFWGSKPAACPIS